MRHPTWRDDAVVLAIVTALIFAVALFARWLT